MGRLARKLRGFLTVALDTPIFIYHFEKSERYFKVTQEIFSRLDTEKNFTAVTSIITLIELTVKPLREARHDLVKEYTQKLLFDDKLTTFAVDEEIARKAAELRANYGIKTPDAVQIATALVAQADAFITNDAELKRIEVQVMPQVTLDLGRRLLRCRSLSAAQIQEALKRALLLT